MRKFRVLTVILASALAGAATFAQVGRGGSEWLTAYADAQRTSWIRTDAKISVETMSAPGFELQWTSKLDNVPRRLNGLGQGVTANGVTLFVPVSIVTGSSNNVYMIDNDTGHVVWKRNFGGTLPAATAACPGGITAAATRIVPAALPAPPVPPRAGGGGRANTAVGYRSVVGEPGEGVPTGERGVSAGRAAAPPQAAGAGRGPGGPGAPGAGPGAPPAGPPRGGGGGGGGRGPQPGSGIPGAPADLPSAGFGRVSGVAYAAASDGQLHVMGLQSGKDLQRPAPFVPANSRLSNAIAVGTMLYSSTSGNCGGAPNAIWAIDLESASKPVVSWKTNGGPIVGNIAFAPDGTLIAVVGPGTATGDGKVNSIVSLDPNTLQLKHWFKPEGELASVEFVTGPMIFRHRDMDLVAAGTKDGRILLVNAASLAGANGGHTRPLYASPSFPGATIATDALSTWQEMTVAPPAADAAPNTPPTTTLGTRWILVPLTGRLPSAVPATNGAFTTGTVVALKLSDSSDGMSLQSAWTSHNLNVPSTPLIVNGVVFALGTGRPATPAARGTPAVLYAYEAISGKRLWDSGQTMKTFASPGSFWSAMGQVYVGTHDGNLQAYGFLDERR
jgi:outer membrane protein assembly factor BamB